MKAYCELGKVLDILARKRNVRGPYSIARQINTGAQYEVSGQVISRYLYGSTRPSPNFIRAFVQAFDLSKEECDTLAWFYTYESID
jgi:hypothetical protein